MNQDSFRQAEQRFRWLTQECSAGRMDQASYRAAIGEIRVTDEQGRLWMLQEGSGTWHRWLGDRWVADSPYPAAGAAAGAGATAPLAMAQTSAAPATGGVGGKIILKLLGVLAFWGVVAIAVLIFVPNADEGAALGIAAAGLLSLILTAASLLRHWEGQIVDIRQERERVSDDDGYSHYRTVTYAYVRQPSGKTRKQRAARDWQVGDYLQKRRGESHIRKLS